MPTSEMSEDKRTENGFPKQNGSVGHRVGSLVSPGEISPKTPEQNEDANKRRMNAFTNAPKTKFIGPPILKTKIKPQDAVANGVSSMHMQSKTIKYTNRNLQRPEQSNCIAKPTSKGLTSFSYQNLPQNQANTQISTVHISKGIAMKRVDKVTCEASVSRIASSSSAASRNQNSRAPQKTELGISGKKSEKNSKPNAPKEKKTKTKPVVSAATVKCNSSTHSTPEKVEVGSVQNTNSKLVSSTENSPLETYGYKTLEEFLGMPEIEDLRFKKTASEIDKPKSLFKSQFWEYLDPHKKRVDERYAKNKEKEKKYDPVEVKSYMEKQKEIRKLKEAREYKERQHELDRKKKLLNDLNDKCRSINARRSLVAKKSVPSTAPAESQVFVDGKPRNPKARHSEGSMPSIPVSSTKSPTLLTRSADSASEKRKYSSEQDVNVNASILLREFEHIVKKECMQVLKNHMRRIPEETSKGTPVSPPRRQTYDKAVETTISLERNEDNISFSKDSSTVSSLKDDSFFINQATAGPRFTHKQIYLAASKIQAWFRGCRTRKSLREANIIPYLRHKKDPRCRRRMSFYRTPEKPYDSPIQRRLSCVSPARIPVMAQGYIPPQEQASFSEFPASVSTPRNFMPTSLRLKPFDEPFPKEVIEKIQQQKQQLNIITKNTTNTRYSSEGFGNIGTHFNDVVNGHLSTNQPGNQFHNLQRQFASESPLSTFVQTSMNAYRNIEAPTPTIAEVLKEKVRAFSQELQTRDMIKGSLPKKSSSDNHVPSVSNGQATHRYKYDSEFESYTEPHSVTNERDYPSGGRTLSSRVATPEIPESDATKGSQSKYKTREDSKKRKASRKTKYEDSTTTVDTDADLVSNTSRDFSMVSSSPEVSMMKSNTEQKTSGAALTTTTNLPTSSLNMQSLPTPALELCFKAEIERMQIVEKAYLCSLNHERKQQLMENQRLQQERETKYRADLEAAQAKLEKEKEKRRLQQKKTDTLHKEQLEKEMQEVIKRRSVASPQTPDVNLALLNCQKEALTATAVIAGMIDDLQKSSREKLLLESQQQPINMASMVYAAVDEARRRDDEKRREEEKRHKRREFEKRRALKEKELEKEKERERRKTKELAKVAAVTHHDKQVQFPTSSMCESSRPSSVQEGQSNQHHRRLDSVRKSEMKSVSKAQGQLEKHLQQSKKVLQRIYTDEDISSNLSEQDLHLLHLDPAEVIQAVENGETDISHSSNAEVEERVSSGAGMTDGRKYSSSSLEEKSREESRTSNNKEYASLTKTDKISLELSKSLEYSKPSGISQEIPSVSTDIPHSHFEIEAEEDSFEDDIVSEDNEELLSLKEKSLSEKSKEGLENLSEKSKDGLENLSEKSKEELEILSEKLKEELEILSEKSKECLEKLSVKSKEGLENLSKILNQQDNLSVNKTDAELSLENFKPSSDVEEREDVSTEIPNSDIEFEEGEEESFEDMVASNDNDELLLKEKEQSLIEKSDDGNKLKVADATKQKHMMIGESDELVQPEQLTKSSELLKTSSVIDEDENVPTESPHFELEAEEDSFEDDIVSEDNEELLSLKETSVSEKSKDGENLSEKSERREILSEKSEGLEILSEKSEGLEILSEKSKRLEILSEKSERLENLSEKSEGQEILSDKSKDGLENLSEKSKDELENLSEKSKDELENLSEKSKGLENLSENSKGELEILSKKSKDGVENVSEKCKEDLENLSEKSKEDQENLSEKSKEDQENLSEKSKEDQENLSEKSKEDLENLSEKSKEDLENLSDKFKEDLENLSDKSKEDLENLSEKSKEWLEKLSEKSKEGLENLSEILDEKDNLSVNITDAELSLEKFKPSGDVGEREDVSTEIPNSDIEFEEDEEESFEDDVASDDNDELLLKEKEQSLIEKSDDGNELEVADAFTEQKDMIDKSDELVQPEQLTKSSELLKPSSVVDEDDNVPIDSPHFEIEAEEEEWFEDEMVSDGKEDEALKLEAAKIKEEQNRIENEIRALEALQAQVPPVTQRTSLGLSDIPDKPPPPYSPPSSDSFSVSSRSFVTAVTEHKIKEIVVKQVNDVWNVWKETKTLPPLSADVTSNPEINLEDLSEEGTPATGFQSLQQTANRGFESMLTDFVGQKIRELLLVDDGTKPYIEKVRPGPMTLQAQQMRIPKSKEELIEAVLTITKANTPFNMVSDSNVNSAEYGVAWKKRLTKWSSRPRDQVDEILVEELIQENSEWTEFWPEELIVAENTCKKIVRSALRDVLRKLKSASKQ